MERVSVDELESVSNPGSRHDKRRVAAALGTTDLSLNHYHLEPGQEFSVVMHTHADQEEIFYVMAGTATFHTPDGDVAVGPEEAIRFAPGEFQRGVNESDERVEALGIGPMTEGPPAVRAHRACGACGESDTLRFVPGDDGMELQCPACGERSDLHG